jgi:hypothetical protein
MSDAQAGRFNNLDELLNETSVDYWSDEGVTIAQEILVGLGDDEWAHLAHKARAESSLWKRNFCDALSHPRSLRAGKLLVEFLSDPDQVVVLAAADSLRFQLPLAGSDRDRVLGRAQQLLTQASPIYQVSLKALIGAIAKPELVA